MSTASEGQAFEHEVRDIFWRSGFSVIRGAASKGEMLDERVDLIATKLTRKNRYAVTLLVVGAQCKVRAVATKAARTLITSKVGFPRKGPASLSPAISTESQLSAGASTKLRGGASTGIYLK